MVERYVFRTKNFSPSAYEQALARAIFGILEKNIHGLADIVSELNKTSVRPPDGSAWTAASFSAEMERLGAWPNSVGGPLGSHVHPLRT